MKAGIKEKIVDKSIQFYTAYLMLHEISHHWVGNCVTLN